MIVNESPNGDGVEIRLRGEEAAIFTQFLVEAHNYNNRPDMAAPVHMALKMLQTLDLEHRSVADIADMVNRLPFVGYEPAFSALRGWMGQHRVEAFDDSGPTLWEIYRLEKGILEPGAEPFVCTARKADRWGRPMLCALPPHGEEEAHRWVIDQTERSAAAPRRSRS